MSVEAFLDTNVLVYAAAGGDGPARSALTVALAAEQAPSPRLRASTRTD